jgi:molybdopterin molybdotransferase
MSSCDCALADAKGPELKPLEAALELLLRHARPVTEVESLATEAALGRVLAEPLLSALAVPPWDNSAMDGYAVRCVDIPRAGVRLPVSQRIAAGQPAAALEPGSAVRIFTGAPIPAGADAVVMQEACVATADAVVINDVPRAGANIRRAGEDIGKGDELIAAGVRLRPQHLGLAASVGAARLWVFRRLRVAIFSSGDELVMPGQALRPGQIYNSNQFTLQGLLQAHGCEVHVLGIVEDTLAATMAALAAGAAKADLVLASGGVSVGEEDHVKPAVERLGSLDLWKIAIRPGKPLAFGHIQGTPFIGAPGNPVSLFVTFCLFARPFILRCQGQRDTQVPALTGVADFDWPRPDKRREFVRARLTIDAAGVARIAVFPSRSSGVLSSVAWANGLAVIPEGACVRKGDAVQFLSFSELMT